MTTRLPPGAIRDLIVASLKQRGEASVAEIREDVERSLGKSVAASSVRSYLNLNVPETFVRVRHGCYRLATRA